MQDRSAIQDDGDPGGPVVERFEVKLVAEGCLALADLCDRLKTNRHEVTNRALWLYELWDAYQRAGCHWTLVDENNRPVDYRSNWSPPGTGET